MMSRNFRSHWNNHCSSPPFAPLTMPLWLCWHLFPSPERDYSFCEGWTRTFLFFRTIHPKAKSRLLTFNRPHQHHPNLVSIVNTTCGVVSCHTTHMCYLHVTHAQWTATDNSTKKLLSLWFRAFWHGTWLFFASIFSCTNQFGSNT